MFSWENIEELIFYIYHTRYSEMFDQSVLAITIIISTGDTAWWLKVIKWLIRYQLMKSWRNLKMSTILLSKNDANLKYTLF